MPKERTQGEGGSRKKLATACRGMTSLAIPAWRKGHCHQGQVRDKALPRIQKGHVRDQTSGEIGRHQWTNESRVKTAATSEEGEDNRQWHQGTEQEARAKSGKQISTQQYLQDDCRAGDRKANSRTSIRLENERQGIVKGSAPSETKEETAHRVRAGDVGALATLGSFDPTDRKSRMLVINLNRLTPYEETAQGEQP
jgi:hypothetical protein